MKRVVEIFERGKQKLLHFLTVIRFSVFRVLFSSLEIFRVAYPVLGKEGVWFCPKRLSNLEQICSELLRNRKFIDYGKPHMDRLEVLDGDHSTLNLSPDIAYLRRIAISYFGIEAKLDSWGILRNVQNQNQFSSSQLAHIDHRSPKIFKVFMYLNNVSASNGPFKYLPCDKSTRFLSSIGRYKRGEKLSDAELGMFRNQFISVEGHKGTLFACDTCRVFHFGGRVLSGQRIMLVLSFLPEGI